LIRESGFKLINKFVFPLVFKNKAELKESDTAIARAFSCAMTAASLAIVIIGTMVVAPSLSISFAAGYTTYLSGIMLLGGVAFAARKAGFVD
jgi:hypothetical protein